MTDGETSETDERTPIQIAAQMLWEDPNVSQETVANALGIGRTTLWRWRKTDEFRAAYRELGRVAMQELAPLTIHAVKRAWAKGTPSHILEIWREWGMIGNERIEVAHVPTDDEILALRDKLRDRAD